MARKRLFGLMSLLLGLLVIITGTVAADGFSILGEPYPDTRTSGFDRDTSKVRQAVYIANGDFSAWTDGLPDSWTLIEPVMAPNWEVHVGRADYARGSAEERGVRNALAIFVRAGSEGSQFVNFYQQVSPNLRSGDHWIQLHMSAWQDKVTSAYNSVAWYGFGDSADPASVTEWRELYPAEVTCHVSAERCTYYGRRELVNVEAGSYLHLQVGMKFPDHQSWTTFWIDEISLTAPLDEATTVEVDDFYDTDATVRWNEYQLR